MFSFNFKMLSLLSVFLSLSLGRSVGCSVCRVIVNIWYFFVVGFFVHFSFFILFSVISCCFFTAVATSLIKSIYTSVMLDGSVWCCFKIMNSRYWRWKCEIKMTSNCFLNGHLVSKVLTTSLFVLFVELGMNVGRRRVLVHNFHEWHTVLSIHLCVACSVLTTEPVLDTATTTTTTPTNSTNMNQTT